MKTINFVHSPSYQPDIRLVIALTSVRNVLFTIATVVCVAILLAWIFPFFATLLPSGWHGMKANTAICILLCLFLIKHLSDPVQQNGKVWAALSLLFVLSLSALLGYWGWNIAWLGNLIGNDTHASITGHIPLQTDTFFLLCTYYFLYEKITNGSHDTALNAISLTILGFVLLLGGGYFYNAVHMFQTTSTIHTSPQTIICMIVTVYGIFLYRSRQGLFSVLTSIGMGSYLARLSMPWVFLLPLFLVSATYVAIDQQWVEAGYASSMLASSFAIAMLILVLKLAQKSNELEEELRQMSLMDHLTGIHNIRGLYVLGEFLLLKRIRLNTPLVLVFFDMDNLKGINDVYGHDAGSEAIKAFALLLKASFRDTDVIARIGGDEFAVATQQTDLEQPLTRLAKAVKESNNSGQHPYTLAYSFGQASLDQPCREHPELQKSLDTFKALIDKADRAMYVHKRARKQHQQ
ncbi:MAG: hypothetical protein AUK35_04005 [Zetaproteobacteria bacterium CG2_30_46_52]|nr:MAG: hypothetical protein AUK35_04005 [Zetaproteobacteria bacterium CG2_30_46_52]